MIRANERDEALRISRQVLREQLATVARPQPWSAVISMDVASDRVARLVAGFDIPEDGPAVYARDPGSGCARGGEQVHDANIETDGEG